MSVVRTNDAANLNTNRHVRFQVEVETTPAADVFVSLQGPNNFYPYYGRIQDPTLAQELAVLRLSLVTRVLSQWAILVGVQVAQDTSANDGGAVILTYEQDEMGVFYNDEWGRSVVDGSAIDPPYKHTSDNQTDTVAGDITDTVGTGGLVSGPKTKRGLQSLLDQEAFDVSYDDGDSGPFGTLSTTANNLGGDVTLPDGRVVPQSQVIPLTPTSNASGLTVNFLPQ